VDTPHAAPSGSVPTMVQLVFASQLADFTKFAHLSTCPVKLFAPGAALMASHVFWKFDFQDGSIVATEPHCCACVMIASK
jgi:hypothetical protein